MNAFKISTKFKEKMEVTILLNNYNNEFKSFDTEILNPNSYKFKDDLTLFISYFTKRIL